MHRFWLGDFGAVNEAVIVFAPSIASGAPVRPVDSASVPRLAVVEPVGMRARGRRDRSNPALRFTRSPDSTVSCVGCVESWRRAGGWPRRRA